MAVAALTEKTQSELIDGCNSHFEIIEALHDLRFHKMAESFRNCKKTGHVLVCTDGHQVFIPARCDLRICLDCSWRLGGRLKTRYAPVLRELRKSRRSGYGLKFLTLTKRNLGRPDTHEAFGKELKLFFKAVRKFINRTYRKKDGCGALAVLEVSTNFTIHCHAVVYGPYVPQSQLSKLWLKITGDSPVVDIRRVQGFSVTRPLNYILKYILKPCQFEAAPDYAFYLAALRGVRRVHSYGVLYDHHESEREETQPTRCPLCGGSLRFDKDFRTDYGVVAVSFLRFLGIQPLFA